ncbi:MAG TPA: hypothetical protein VGR89_09245 [Puia sp.]|nr:hypothetical protein [Puia sp.]
MAKKQSGTYIPGVCNINREEIARRRMIGYIGLASTLALFGLLELLHASVTARLSLFIPAYVCAIGFLQAANHFCTGYGSRGMQNATEGSLAPSEVTDGKALAADRRRVAQINMQAAVIAIVVALAAVAI